MNLFLKNFVVFIFIIVISLSNKSIAANNFQKKLNTNNILNIAYDNNKWNYVYSWAKIHNDETTATYIANLVTKYCTKYNLDTKIIARLIFTESEYITWKKSYKRNKQGKIVRDKHGKAIKIAYGIMMIHKKYWSHLLFTQFPELKGKLNTDADIEKYLCYLKYNIAIGCFIANYYICKNNGSYELGLTEYWAGNNSDYYKQLKKDGIRNKYINKILDDKKMELNAKYLYAWKYIKVKV